MSAKALGKQPAYRQVFDSRILYYYFILISIKLKSATAASGSNRLDKTHQYSMGGFRKRKASELGIFQTQSTKNLNIKVSIIDRRI